MDTAILEAEFKTQNEKTPPSLPLITLDCSQLVDTEITNQILLQNLLVEMHLTVFWQ